MEVSSQASAYGRLYAPDRDLSVGGNGAWYGSAAVRTLTLSGGTGEPLFAVDESAQGAFRTDPTEFELYARWPD